MKLYQLETWRKFVLSKGGWCPNKNDLGTFTFYVPSPIPGGTRLSHLTVNASMHKSLFEAQKLAALVYLARCQGKSNVASAIRSRELRERPKR
jgi:hypothetical protein